MDKNLNGIWIPREVLELGYKEIINWVWAEYRVNLLKGQPEKEAK